MSLFDGLSGGYLTTLVCWLLLLGASLYSCVRLRRRFRGRPRPLRVVHTFLSVWFVLSSITALEVYFALFYDETDSFGHTNVTHRWLKRHVQRNRGNFRDRHEMPIRLPAGRRHVCFIGDSFTFGHGIRNVDDRFSDRVAKRLSEDGGGGIHVSNAADIGMHVGHIVDRAQMLFEGGVQPDVLIYIYCLNDIECFDQKNAQTQIELRERIKPTFFLLRDTYFLNLAYFRIRQAHQPQIRNYFLFLEDSYEGPAWTPLQATLDKLRDICSDHGVQVHLVVFPFLQNLGAGYAFDEAHERLAAYCRQRQIPHLDLSGVLTPHIDEGLVVNRFDAHPNERAHELVAEAIEQHLRRHLRLSQPLESGADGVSSDGVSD